MNNNITVGTLKRKYQLASSHTTRAFNELKCKKVICKETKKIYNSMGECAKEMKVSNSYISAHIIGKEGYETVKGYTFDYFTPL